MTSWQHERFLERRAAGEAARAERERQTEAERRGQAKEDAIEDRELPTDRHKAVPPAARRPKRPGDYSASRTGVWGL